MHWCGAKALINHHYLKVKVSHGWLAIFNSCVNLGPTIPTKTATKHIIAWFIIRNAQGFIFIFCSDSKESQGRKSWVQESNWNPCDWLSAKNEWFVQEKWRRCGIIIIKCGKTFIGSNQIYLNMYRFWMGININCIADYKKCSGCWRRKTFQFIGFYTERISALYVTPTNVEITTIFISFFCLNANDKLNKVLLFASVWSEEHAQNKRQTKRPFQYFDW